jgi:diguanylate cyclase (GGDEF)-like protein
MSNVLQSLGAPTTNLGRKLGLVVGLPVLLAALLGIGLTWRAALRAAQEDALGEARALSELVASSFSAIDPQRPVAEAPHREVAAALKTDWKLLSSVKNVRVVDQAGRIRWSRHVEEQGQAAVNFDRRLMDEPAGTLQGDTFTLPIGGASCAACHQGDSLHLGAVQLVLAPPQRLGEVDDIYRLAMGGTGLLALLFLAALILGLRVYVTRPVARLAKAMERAKSGDFLVRVPVERDDEVGRLAQGFNSMLARMTELKVAEIETQQDLEMMQRELALKAELQQANSKLEVTVKELSLLFELTRSLNSTLELEPLFNLVCDLVGQGLGYAEFSVMLLSPVDDELVYQAGYGLPPHFKGEVRFKVGEGAAGACAQLGERVYVEDVTTDPRFVRRANEVGALVCVPMTFKEERVGVLNFRKREPASFAEAEMRLLESVANQAAMAIVNARLHEETVELSITDALTGVFNRRHLFKQLDMEVLRAQRFGNPLSVVMIDIDHFKHFNDTAGHPAGDQVLKGTAELLKGVLRKLDTLARYGGEEFMVLLPQIAKSEAMEVAEKLRRAVERTAFPEGDKQPGGKVTISVGVGSFPEDGGDLERLVDATDSALYASKRGGRNKVSAYSRGMEDHPGRERGPKAKARPETDAPPEPAAAPPAPTAELSPAPTAPRPPS